MNKPSQYIFLTTDKLSKEGEICDTAYGFAISGKDGVGMGHHLSILSDEKCKQGEYKYCSFTEKITQYDQFAEVSGTGWCEDCKKIIATTNPSLWYNKTKNGSGDSGVEMISESDIEYIISLYNDTKAFERLSEVWGDDEDGKYKEHYIEKLAEKMIREGKDFKAEGFSEYQNGKLNGIVEGYNQCLKDNSEKKFTLEDMHKAMDIARGGIALPKDCPTNSNKNIIQSLTKEQPKSNTVMVEYEEFITMPQEHLLTGSNIEMEARKNPILKPKLKDGNIIIVK